MKKNSIKYSRMNGEVQREISMIISRDIKDPRIHPVTSVVSVEVTPDLKLAKVFVSVLGSKEDRENTHKGLISAAPAIRSLLAKSLNMRNTPELDFIMDDSIEHGINMSKKIDDLVKEETESLAGENQLE
ncbi:MAG TPA: 30S ribosome-binding factor RbfA [Lachnospiraceae bacterium]|nr:30S ribosome-binding factor RbfA [Lachnospiraceae bacterium]